MSSLLQLGIIILKKFTIRHWTRGIKNKVPVKMENEVFCPFFFFFLWLHLGTRNVKYKLFLEESKEDNFDVTRGGFWTVNLLKGAT